MHDAILHRSGRVVAKFPDGSCIEVAADGARFTFWSREGAQTVHRSRFVLSQHKAALASALDLRNYHMYPVLVCRELLALSPEKITLVRKIEGVKESVHWKLWRGFGFLKRYLHLFVRVCAQMEKREERRENMHNIFTIPTFPSPFFSAAFPSSSLAGRPKHDQSCTMMDL